MLLKKIIYGNQFCSVEHTIKNGEDCFNVLQLVNKKNSLEKTASNSYNSFEEVITSIPKQQQVFVIINNDKILSKKIDGIHELNKSVSLAYPNIKATDFSIEVLPQKTHSFVSICRNQDIDNILNVYKKENIHIIGYSLGNNTVSSITSFLSEKTIQTSNAIISSDNDTDTISDIIKSNNGINESYDINGLEMGSSEIVNFSGILSYYTNTYSTENNFTHQTDQLKDVFKQKKIFSNALKFGLGFILFGLLINFLFFSHYRDRVSLLSNEQQVNERSKEALLSLTNEVNRKKGLASDITSSTNSKVSFYLDEIGASIPITVLLSEIIFQPIQKSIKKDKEIELFSNRISISGDSNNSGDFSDWISELENKEWIDKVSVLEYGVGSKSKIAFEINIKLQK